jgi:hypothetical protein
MIDLAQIEDKVLARLSTVSAEEFEKSLCAKGYDVEVIENIPNAGNMFKLETHGEFFVVAVQQYFDAMSTFADPANSNELALAA